MRIGLQLYRRIAAIPRILPTTVAEPWGAMSLLEAVHRVDVARVDALLSRGANVNGSDGQGVTPLIIASERGGLP